MADKIGNGASDWMTPEQVAEYLGLTTEGVRQWRKLGTGPAYARVSQRVVRYRRSDIDAWLDAHRVTPEGK